MDRRDQQVKGSLVIPRSDGSTSFTDFTDNAASGTNRGLEASIDWRATEALRFSGFIARLDASFDRYVNIDGTDLSGRDQPQAPADQYRLVRLMISREPLGVTRSNRARCVFPLGPP